MKSPFKARQIFKALHPFMSKWVNEIHTGSDWTPPCVAWAHHSLGFSREFVPSTPAIVVFLPKDPLHIPHTARREIFSSVTRTSWQSESGEYPPWSLRLPSLKRTAQPSNGCLQNCFPFLRFRLSSGVKLLLVSRVMHQHQPPAIWAWLGLTNLSFFDPKMHICHLQSFCWPRVSSNITIFAFQINKLKYLTTCRWVRKKCTFKNTLVKFELAKKWCCLPSQQLLQLLPLP